MLLQGSHEGIKRRIAGIVRIMIHGARDWIYRIGEFGLAILLIIAFLTLAGLALCGFKVGPKTGIATMVTFGTPLYFLWQYVFAG